MEGIQEAFFSFIAPLVSAQKIISKWVTYFLLAPLIFLTICYKGIVIDYVSNTLSNLLSSCAFSSSFNFSKATIKLRITRWIISKLLQG